ncbi:MAG: T9SS type A sorting domain-containing protein [Bacteroidetes bacterium]|nr:MAG: T9SS type A sorting domain-containing protein [Bacteroidota bacterium]
MFRKILVFSLMFLLFSLDNKAQYFEWISHHQSQYSLNPDMVNSPIAIFSDGAEVNARLDSFAIHYSQDAFGKVFLEKRDAAGIPSWSITLSKKVFIKKIVTDLNHNVYICGGFMDTLNFDGLHELLNIASGLNVNKFLAKIDAGGQLLWKRNLELTHPLTNLEDLQIDLSGNLWYAINDFNNSALYQVDSNGDDLDSLIQDGALLLTSFSFDPYGNIFIAGATEGGIMTFGNQSYTVIPAYAKFIGRYDANRNASWAHFANDITFLNHKVVSDELGNAYLAGVIYDSTNFGTLTFPRPQWSQEFFLLKIDSLGIFQWGKSNPAGTSAITGRFTPTADDCIDVDLAGNIYLSGRSAGILDWGNGVVLTAGLGQLYENRLSIISFDPNGNTRWGKIFGSETYNKLNALKVAENGDCYFNAAFRDNSVFDSTAYIGNSLMNFVIGKISASALTGVSKLFKNHFSIYPVPSSGKINISGDDVEVEIRIYDLSGKLMLNQVQYTRTILDASHLQDGYYLVKLISGKVNENISWVKLSK